MQILSHRYDTRAQELVGHTVEVVIIFIQACDLAIIERFLCRCLHSNIVLYLFRYSVNALSEQHIHSREVALICLITN